MAVGDLDDLARRYGAGERKALAELWQALRPQLEPHLRCYRLRKPDGPLELADLEQQAFLIVEELARSWPGRGAFAAWCHRLLPLRLLDYRRAVLRFDDPVVICNLPPAELIELAERVPNFGEAPDHAELVCCRRLLSVLPPLHRRLLSWRFGDCLSFREIERLHGLPAATAQVECARALAYLRAAIEGENPAPLRPLYRPQARATRDLGPAIRGLWQLADAAGVLPPAPQARKALGLGERGYEVLVGRLHEAGCLGLARGVAFAARGGRRWRLAVEMEEAVRRLGQRDPRPGRGEVPRIETPRPVGGGKAPGSPS